MPALLAPQKLQQHFKLRDLELRGIVKRQVAGAESDIAQFAGYLAVFGNVDSYGTRLNKGCFTKSLQERSSFPLLADHNSDQPMGSFTAEERDRGLWCEFELILGISYAKDKWLALANKAIDGLSVGFSIVKRQTDEENGVVDVLEARLWEGSVCTFPANDMARVEVLRSLGKERAAMVVALSAAMSSAQVELADETTIHHLGQDGAAPLALKRLDLILADVEKSIQALRSAAMVEGAASAEEPGNAHSAEDLQGLLKLAQDTNTLTLS